MDKNDISLEKIKGVMSIVIVVGLVVAVTLFASFTIVPPGHKGVILTLGAVNQNVMNEGFNLKIPFIQNIVHMDCRVQKTETAASAASKDLQTVSSKIAINYRIVSASSAKLYQNIGMGYNERVIAPAVQESVKAVTARFTAEELITKRQEVSMQIQEVINDKLRDYYITVDRLNITSFEFSEEFNKAIESKQTAEQLALKAQRDLERIEIEGKQKIVQAKAEAEALRLQRQEVSKELIELRKIEANLKAIEKWNGVLPKVTGGSTPLIGLDESKL